MEFVQMMVLPDLVDKAGLLDCRQPLPRYQRQW